MIKHFLLAGATVALFSLNTSGCSEDDAVTQGRERYDNTCALCHGANGEGYKADNATALASQTFLATASDSYLKTTIKRGRPGTTMSAWDTIHGGPYDDAAIDTIVAYIRSWQKTSSVALTADSVGGDAQHGSSVFLDRCSSCHGATGTEGPFVRLGNAEFLNVASDRFLQYAINEGRPGTGMQPFKNELSQNDIVDVVALLRSWAKPVSAGDVPIPGTLGPVIPHPDGPEPDFVLGNRYTPADTIKRELDRGASFGFLDARPPADYSAGHIAGANNVPFYEAASYVSALPKDKWLVCYCACPHAESGRLADTLFENGFTKVTILDEGYLVWRDRGYPVNVGANP